MRASRKSTLLDAATAIVHRDGGAALTLDAVAKESGTSKGGVLYHFPTKEALVLGMVTRMVEHFDRGLATESAAHPPSPGRMLRAYVASSLEEDAYSPSVRAALVAAMSTNPRLLDPLRERFAAWQAELCADGLDAAWGTLVRLAIDGLWLADLFDLAPPTGTLRRDVVDVLVGITQRDRRAVPARAHD